MANKLAKIIFGLAGLVIGACLAFLLLQEIGTGIEGNAFFSLTVYFTGALIGITLFSLLRKQLFYFEIMLQKRTFHEIMAGSAGFVIGLIIANLISIPILHIPIVGIILSLIINMVLGYLGISIASRKHQEISENIFFFKKSTLKHVNTDFQPKILDTSVIIDGRIADLCQTGFIEGSLVIPSFVLRELQHIADSSDALKRNRGRRGLDILNVIQKELKVPVKILDKDFEDIAEVDSKLLKLAETIQGKIITNDYNLNKVANFQGVPVLNINELANAVKPVALPGEDMVVQVVKDGKENGQGVAYLDDGTMIVVDGGKRHIGESIGVLVTSVLQTPAGRMIFAKPKYEAEKAG